MNALDAEKPALYLLSPKRSHDEYRTRNNSLPRRGEKVHDSRNRGDRVLMHRAHGNAIDDLLFYNLAIAAAAAVAAVALYTSTIILFSPSNR